MPVAGLLEPAGPSTRDSTEWGRISWNFASRLRPQAREHRALHLAEPAPAAEEAHLGIEVPSPSPCSRADSVSGCVSLRASHLIGVLALGDTPGVTVRATKPDRARSCPCPPAVDRERWLWSPVAGPSPVAWRSTNIAPTFERSAEVAPHARHGEVVGGRRAGRLGLHVQQADVDRTGQAREPCRPRRSESARRSSPMPMRRLKKISASPDCPTANSPAFSRKNGPLLGEEQIEAVEVDLLLVHLDLREVGVVRARRASGSA